jgi:hypothetical protein
MPKFCIRDDGAVYPYSPALATNSRFKVVDELPGTHLRSIERSKVRVDSRAEASRNLRQSYDARIAARKASSDAVRVRVAAGPAVNAEASAEAQRQADEFTQKIEAPAAPAASANDGAFVIATATEEQLRQYAKDTFNVTLHHKAGIDKLRAKVAELAGVKAE